LTHLSQLLTIQRDGYRLHFFPSSLSATLWAHPEAYRDEERFTLSRLPADGIYVDVGANIGPLVCAVASRCHGARVVAFEPHPRIFRFLKKNVELNGLLNVILHNIGLAAQPGDLYISNKRADDMNVVSNTGTRIQVARLDDVLAPMTRIDLLKIDVEGFELEVLRGAKEMLSRTRQVYFEAFEPQYRRFGYGFAQVRALLEAEGFLISQVRPDMRLDGPLPPHFVPDRCCNMLAIKNSS
jgi:FkbM family methyltransferase